MAVDSGSYTPETLARRYKMAEQLLATPQPIRHWAEGLNEVAKGALGGYQLKRTEDMEKAARADAIAQALNAFGGGVPPAAAAPAADAAPVAAQPTADMSLPRGIRNNNPLNIEAGGFTQGQPGFAGSDGRFAKFETPEQGTAAAAKLLDTYQNKYGLNTPAGIIGRWAPTADGNNSSAYAANVAKALNIGPNDPVPPEMRPQLIAAMGQQENGRPIAPQQGAVLPQQMAQAAPQGPVGSPPAAGNNRAAIAALLNPWTPPAVQGALAKQLTPEYGFQTLPDGTIVRTNPRTGQVEPTYQAPTKNTFGVIGENRDGQKIYGIINPEKGTATPVPVPGTASAPGATDAPGVTGDDYLKSLNDPGRADLIKGMVEGRMAPATMGRYGTQAVQSLLKDAARYEPGFDMTKWGARAATAKDFASGQAAKNVTSLNTVIGHLGDLSEKADALGNASFTPYNEYIKNPIANMTGKPEVKNFNLARNAVADEMAKVFRGGGLSDAETRQWKENISAAGSPEQLKGAVKTAIGLMESRLNALGEQRNKGMSTQTEPMALLTDKSRATLDKVRKWADGEAAPAAAAPDRSAIEAEMRKRGLLK